MDSITVHHGVPQVDLVLLSRHAGPLHPEVERGLRDQLGVRIVLHRVVGQAMPKDRCRFETIARARNEGMQCGAAPWLMFVDDDVVLDPHCVCTLMRELGRRPVFAALAADYLGECRSGQVAGHVAMGATLFRRPVLEQLRFRWTHDKCECRCCCDDLRRLHWGIDYCSSAVAHHLTLTETNVAKCDPQNPSTAICHVLAAFNRRHRLHFQKQFLGSLRASGNEEPLIALAMGLYPSEQRQLRRLPALTLVPRPDNGLFVGLQRLHAFQNILSTLPGDSAVAYWDAGDMVFQGSLKPLWQLVLANPEKILAVREPIGHPENHATAVWTQGIRNLNAKRRAQALLFNNPFLNSGFLAGTAQSLLDYFRTVADWYRTPTLAGSSDPGDQIALNLYCHSHPERWLEVSEGWNYCLAHRRLDAVYRDQNGRYVDVRGVPIQVLHGNAQTLHTVPLRRRRLRTAPI